MLPKPLVWLHGEVKTPPFSRDKNRSRLPAATVAKWRDPRNARFTADADDRLELP
jgi:hypothetical protein